MDILTHTLSGVAVATCAMTFVPKVKTKVSLFCVGAIGGAFPDLDAISLWSHFDGTLGKFFGLATKGSTIYGAKLWYSHHAFLHSLLGSLLLGSLLMLMLYFFGRKKFVFTSFLRAKLVYLVTFVLAYWTHLLGDLPTPSSVWGGIGLLWPSTNYVGGYGKIWWWNNYDIFLLIVCCIVVNLLVLLSQKRLKEKAKKIIPAVFVFFFAVILFQINTRKFDYAYTKDNSKYAQMEQNSKSEQQRILGKTLYNAMEAFDKKLKFYF